MILQFILIFTSRFLIDFPTSSTPITCQEARRTVNIYLFKVNTQPSHLLNMFKVSKKNTGARSLTLIMSVWCFTVNFEHISHKLWTHTSAMITILRSSFWTPLSNQSLHNNLQCFVCRCWFLLDLREPVVAEAGSSSFSTVSTASGFVPVDANAKRLLNCGCLCSSSLTCTSSLLSDVEINWWLEFDFVVDISYINI